MNALRRLAVSLACALLLLSVFTAAGFADTDDQEPPAHPPSHQIDENTINQCERVVGVKTDNHEADVTSTLESGIVHNEFDIKFTAEDKIELEMRYKKDNNSADINLELKLKFMEIVEFVDSNANGRYDISDKVPSRYNLQEINYRDIVYATKNTSDNKTEHVLSAQTSDGVFRIVLHIVDTFAQLESGIISPSEVKIDFIIHGYSYREEDTQLALRTEIETEAKTETNNGTFNEKEGISENEDEVQISTGNVTAFFSWANSAAIDGVSMPVNVTSATGSDRHREIYFSYPRGNIISHDPKLGFPYYRALPGSDFMLKAAPYLAAFAAGALVIGLAVYRRRKKNGFA